MVLPLCVVVTIFVVILAFLGYIKDENSPKDIFSLIFVFLFYTALFSSVTAFILALAGYIS